MTCCYKRNTYYYDVLCWWRWRRSKWHCRVHIYSMRTVILLVFVSDGKGHGGWSIWDARREELHFFSSRQISLKNSVKVRTVFFHVPLTAGYWILKIHCTVQDVPPFVLACVFGLMGYARHFHETSYTLNVTGWSESVIHNIIILRYSSWRRFLIIIQLLYHICAFRPVASTVLVSREISFFKWKNEHVCARKNDCTCPKVTIITSVTNVCRMCTDRATFRCSSERNWRFAFRRGSPCARVRPFRWKNTGNTQGREGGRG